MKVKRTLAMHRSKLTPPVKRLHFQSRAYANKHNQSECVWWVKWCINMQPYLLIALTCKSGNIKSSFHLISSTKFLFCVAGSSDSHANYACLIFVKSHLFNPRSYTGWSFNSKVSFQKSTRTVQTKQSAIGLCIRFILMLLSKRKISKSGKPSLRSMAVLSSRAQERRSHLPSPAFIT